MEAVGDKCKTRRHDVDFKQWIQYYDAYSVKRSSSRRVLLYVYAVFVGLFAVPVFVKLCLYILFIDELFPCPSFVFMLIFFFFFALLRYVPNVLYFKRM